MYEYSTRTILDYGTLCKELRVRLRHDMRHLLNTIREYKNKFGLLIRRGLHRSFV